MAGQWSVRTRVSLDRGLGGSSARDGTRSIAQPDLSEWAPVGSQKLAGARLLTCAREGLRRIDHCSRLSAPGELERLTRCPLPNRILPFPTRITLQRPFHRRSSFHSLPCTPCHRCHEHPRRLSPVRHVRESAPRWNDRWLGGSVEVEDSSGRLSEPPSSFAE